LENSDKTSELTRERAGQPSNKCQTRDLPEIADTDKISAEYKDGVLNILIPKKESAIKKPQKRIEIK